jgi:anti-sigma regulatory factor (Ser/Thr protein kinase)
MTQSRSILFETRIPHRIERLPALLDEIQQFAESARWDSLFSAQLLLVVEELVVNAVSYGGRDPDEGWVDVRFDRIEDGLSIVITDNGQPYDPFESAPEPDLDLDLDSRPVGGLGVHFVKEMTDTQTYVRTESGNRITLLKRWPREE